MNQIEILAPAGSVESMKAAINAGCDAVYIGGSMFGARAYANNLDEETLLRAIDYVHVRGKQLYLTVNTLLKNDELNSSLYNYLHRFYQQGLDAVIVQDVGVMHFIHEHFPNLPIHASTQMSLTMGEGANELKNYGVTRLVPARELGIKEIARIRKSTDLEIEAFVHGALCYSYSGQCFMSSMIGGRSGNRGRCAQPCRMEYKAEEEGHKVSQTDNSYLLSPKDMCTLPMTAELIEAGIDSFKIEGRMKRPEYAAGVVLAYRKQADLYYELGPEGYREYHKKNPKVMEYEMQKLKDLYNRGGFSTGYYESHNGKQMMSMHRPNHSGVEVGKVTARKGIQAEILLSNDVNAQDILEFRHNGDKTYEFTVKDGAKKGTKLVTNTKPGSPINIGDEVYRTKNDALLTELEADYMEQDKKIIIDGHLHAKVGEPLSLTLHAKVVRTVSGTNVKKEEELLSITECGDVVDRAQKQPMNAANVEEKLRKTKETPFEFEHVNVEIVDEVFFPIGKLNELRRTALARMEEEMASEYRRDEVQSSSHVNTDSEDNQIDHVKPADHTECASAPASKSESKESLGLIANVKTMDQFMAACENEFVKDIYVDLAENAFPMISEYGRRGKNAGKSIYLLLPHIFRAKTYDEFVKNKEYLEDENISGYVLKNMEELSFVRNVLKTCKELRTDYNMYVMNDEAVKFYEEQGIQHFTASIELNQSELATLPMQYFDLLAYGYVPLMVSAQCVKKNTSECRLVHGKETDWLKKAPIILTDRKQMKLSVRTNCHYCYNSIYNSQCISLLGSSNDVMDLKPANLRLDFTIEDKAETTKVLSDFEQVYRYGKMVEYDSASYSKGHLKRGIL